MEARGVFSQHCALLIVMGVLREIDSLPRASKAVKRGIRFGFDQFNQTEYMYNF